MADEFIDDLNDITLAMKEKHIIVPSPNTLGKAVLISEIKQNSQKTK